MDRHEVGAGAGGGAPPVDCDTDPVGSLVAMFVDMVQLGRIQAGQCPALRPVFLKPHGVVHGTFRVRSGGLPDTHRIGLFAGTEYPAWVRFSSDTLPTISDYRTTLGIGIKLFGVPGPKLVGDPDARTFDFILQNFDVFFVDTAKDMCEFTRAGVVEGDYDPYLKAHPKTARLLEEMAKPVASVLDTAYWSGLPFSFGPGQYVKYKLEPESEAPPPSGSPADPTYLARDLEDRLKAGPQRFRFLVQLRTDPVTEPLDEATVRWSSPFTHVADLDLPQQDITVRGQPDYGENLAYNIWRVTADHRPQGSIADARKVVYAASADQRRTFNGIPLGEPFEPQPEVADEPCADTVIVHAKIHPGIGVARIGDSPTEFFLAPEVTTPPPATVDQIRPPPADDAGHLKREAARFRIYGYNAAGEVVRELTAQNADIVWTAHLANKKASWYQFQFALDIPEAAGASFVRRNKEIKGPDRAALEIDPGPRSITGANQSGEDGYRFDTGTFDGVTVPLGEIRTDAAGRLIVLGGTGDSASPSDAPVFVPSDPESFNNANDWYDDISDGPVTATVSIDGRPVPVDPAWVVVAPPNYAPDVVGWRTLYDLLTDAYVATGMLPMPATVSFTRDILPVLHRMTGLQWVNAGFAAFFGAGGPMDFSDPALLAKLSATPTGDGDPWQELRRTLLNTYRARDLKAAAPGLWPWIYGDAFGSFPEDEPNTFLALPSVQAVLMRRWADGDFVDDWDPDTDPPRSIDDVPLQERPAMLDQAALHFCLADAFHPGCEMTWPMRHTTMYMAPYRFRHRPADVPEPDYGPNLTPEIALRPGGPLYAQGPGDISRWMALPWQGDTAFCRAGYDPDYDPYLPTFWPARVPNQVLTAEDYAIVMDTGRPRAERLAAFHRRADWLRAIMYQPAPEVMLSMIKDFGAMGVVLAQPGPADDPDFPSTIYVENVPATEAMTRALLHARDLVAVDTGTPADRAAGLPVAGTAGADTDAVRRGRVRQAGWTSEAQLAEWRRIRAPAMRRR